MFVYTAALRPPLYKQLVGVNPEPQIIRLRGINSGSTAAAEERITKTNKTKMIAMRFRESDYAAIKKKAEKVNMNFTEFVTAAAMNKPITVINGLSDVLKEQKAIGRNINQLTTLCNMGKIVCPDLQELKQQYAEVLTTLNEIVGRCG